MQSEKISVLEFSDATVAKRSAMAMATSIGFDSISINEISLVVSELATNVVKHANHGVLNLIPITNGKRHGMQIESISNGPNIFDVEEALTDGFSTTGSLGYGLGTVNRLMDEFDINSAGENKECFKIVCKKWTLPESRTISPCPLDIGAATRKHPKTDINGDAFVIKRWAEFLLVGVIDGLGHGHFAYDAARKARQSIEHKADQPLENIFSSVQRSCRSTRGVVMSLAKFDFSKKKPIKDSKFVQSEMGMKTTPHSPPPIRMELASIGNIEVRMRNRSDHFKFPVRRGIVGRNAPVPIVTGYDWDSTNILVLHSDGLNTHWQWEDFSHVIEKSATLIAIEMLHKLTRETDDAVVAVVKGKRE